MRVHEFKKKKAKCKKDHFILMVGTLDSALYVARFTDDLKKPLACALARTDARNSLSQEVLELDTPIIMVGGANGVLEFFLCKGALDEEPQLEFIKTEMPSLPSNCKYAIMGGNLLYLLIIL
jgi:hypothetical protein